MKMTDEELMELIKRRRRQLTVHSFGYYRLNDNIISDHTFDKWSMELVALQREHPELASQVELHEYFEGFDGSTGFNLPTHLPELPSIWARLKRYKGGE